MNMALPRVLCSTHASPTTVGVLPIAKSASRAVCFSFKSKGNVRTDGVAQCLRPTEKHSDVLCGMSLSELSEDAVEVWAAKCCGTAQTCKHILGQEFEVFVFGDLQNTNAENIEEKDTRLIHRPVRHALVLLRLRHAAKQWRDHPMKAPSASAE